MQRLLKLQEVQCALCVGDFSRVIHQLVNQLIDLRMLVEAMLDFPEEELELPDFSRRDLQLSSIQIELD